MEISKGILDILQLYEFSITIGKTFDYTENCDSFLKRLLTRKYLKKAWVCKKINNNYQIQYSLPIKTETLTTVQKACFQKFEDSKKSYTNNACIKISNVKEGQVALFNLGEEGILFLQNNSNSFFTIKELNQLMPIIQKFANALEASNTFNKQTKLLQNLEQRNQELSDYAHMVSHDLKSPLRNIDALSAWLQEDYKDRFDNAEKESLKIIRNNVEKMERLINGILEYSTIGKKGTAKHPVNIKTIIDTVLDIIHIPEKITIKTAKKFPTVHGNKHRLQQVFQNLINNAIKYNDKPKGIIEIGFEDTEGFWQFFIKDNGKGIDAVYFEKIFKTFEKLDNNPKSSGLGLSIVKKIVDLYDGKTWLTSELGKGTTFYFTLKK